MRKDTHAKIAGLSMLLFCPLLLVGFLLHPDILSFAVSDTPEALVANFHHQLAFHLGHLLVFFAVPFIVLAVAYLMTLRVTHGERWLLIGGVLGVIGAVILAGDKGALCLVLSAFDDLPEAEFQSITPALRVIVERRGLLAVFYLLPLLPLGAALQLIGLIKAKLIASAPGAAAIIGLLLLNNPDIELISSAGAVLMCFGYMPLGARLWRGKTAGEVQEAYRTAG